MGARWTLNRRGVAIAAHLLHLDGQRAALDGLDDVALDEPSVVGGATLDESSEQVLLSAALSLDRRLVFLAAALVSVQAVIRFI